MYNRAVLLERDGQLTEAEEMHRKCLQIRRRVLGDDHQQALIRSCARMLLLVSSQSVCRRCKALWRLRVW
jgi:hypothetical protein